jgi:histidine triad (HIT) family protein
VGFDVDCIFCKIVQSQAPSSIVYEDEFVMAFLDIRPASEGHVLVISKEHYSKISRHWRIFPVATRPVTEKVCKKNKLKQYKRKHIRQCHFNLLYEGILDIPGELLGKVHQVSKRVAVAVKQALSADGINIIQQNGRAANQEVFHIHVHVIPRYLGQKMKGLEELQMVDYEQLGLTADKIKRYI